MGAQRQAEGRRALALAVAGVHQHQATAFAFGLFIGLFRRGLFDLHGVASSKVARAAACMRRGGAPL
jgi:hypothetical protein